MDLQFLFSEPILQMQELSPGYDDHASDVWWVQTAREEVVVRTSRMREEPSNEFWWGCKRLFGIDPRRVHALEAVNNVLHGLGSIPVPRVLSKGVADREYVVVEKLQGHVVRSLVGQPASLLESLGEGIARIHLHTRDYAGNPAGTMRVAQQDFHEHLTAGMTELVANYYREQPSIAEMLPQMIERLATVPVPTHSTFVLIDMDPSQFLTDGDVITGLVDTEAYVIAPRELELIALEYILDDTAAQDFKRGYERVMPIPDLEPYRLPYRYLCRLLRIQGRIEIGKWLNYTRRLL